MSVKRRWLVFWLSLPVMLVAATALTWWLINRGPERRYQEALAASRARFGAMTLEQWAPPPLDDATNAAPLYAKAFEILRTPGFQNHPFHGRVQDDPAELTPEEWKSAEEFVSTNHPAVEALVAAAGRDRCRYTVQYSEGWGMLLEHVPDLLMGARLLAWSLRLDLRAGKVENVEPRLDAIFAAGFSVLDDPILVSQLVRYVIHGVGLDLVEESLGRGVSPDNLASIVRSRFDLAKFEAADLRALQHDLWMIPDTIEKFLRGEELPRGIAPPVSRLDRLIALPRIKLGAARAVEEVTRALPLLDLPRDERIPALNAHLRRATSDPMNFSYLWPSLSKPAQRLAVVETRVRMALAASDLRRQMLRGRPLPEQLDLSVQDAIQGRPLQYERTSDGFVLSLDLTEAEGQDPARPIEPLEWRYPK